MLKNLATVNRWNTTASDYETDKSCLNNAFRTALAIGDSVPSSLFADIWVPIQVRDTNHAIQDPQVWTYKNVGMQPTDIADLYQTMYGYNLLSVPIIESGTGFTGDLTLAKKIKLILKSNLWKYLKWIDEMGYAYNPLWNVEGVEEFQYIDNHGNIIRDNVPILQFKEKLKTNSYDGAEKDTSTTYNAYGGINKNGNTEQYTVSDGSAQTVSELRSRDTETHEDITGQTPQEITGPLIAITGGDFSHIEKRKRSGNIGTVTVTSMLEEEREFVRMNLIKEAFEDINKQLLVGIYPGF